ncbi:MAG: hypothetical protein P8K77_05860 [Polaribacter sp.]|nr:hypothetical protein [Polaribacter sp.]
MEKPNTKVTYRDPIDGELKVAETVCENKYGVVEYLFDQCSSRCKCEDRCLGDDIFFGASAVYEEYRANMKKAKHEK